MTRAAHELGVTQPALSAAVRKLEESVGLPLLNRTARGVEPTEAGRVFLRFADDAVRAAEGGVRAVREIAGLQSGSIRVGGGATAITYLLPNVIGRFVHEHPGVRFFVREAGSNAVARSVLSGELDLGVITLPLTEAGSSDLLAIPLARDELLLIVPPSHKLAGKRTFRWRDVDGEATVAFEDGSAVRDLIDQSARRAGVSLKVVMELRSIESIKSMVAAGVGIGFVSSFALAERDGLACAEGDLARALAIIRRHDHTPGPASAAFERMLTQSIRSPQRGRATARPTE